MPECAPRVGGRSLFVILGGRVISLREGACLSVRAPRVGGRSLYVILGGRVISLANMYTLAFLCVMALFAYGNMMLKSRQYTHAHTHTHTRGHVTAGRAACCPGRGRSIRPSPAAGRREQAIRGGTLPWHHA